MSFGRRACPCQAQREGQHRRHHASQPLSQLMQPRRCKVTKVALPPTYPLPPPHLVQRTLVMPMPLSIRVRVLLVLSGTMWMYCSGAQGEGRGEGVGARRKQGGEEGRESRLARGTAPKHSTQSPEQHTQGLSLPPRGQ